MENKIKSLDILTTRLCELLKSEAYSESTIKEMTFVINALSAYMDSQSLEEYSPEVGEKFVSYCRKDLHTCSSREWRAKSVVNKLNRLSRGLDGKTALLHTKSKELSLPEGLKKSLTDYISHCEDEENKKSTIKYKYWLCGRFLENISNLGCKEIWNMTGENIQTAFLALGHMRYWPKLRPYFHFLFDNNLLPQDYSNLIQNCRFHVPQPTVYSVEEIRCIENSFDLSSASGVRNYAITLLMTRYGIRACDVAALEIEAIDFENNRLKFIQQKTGEPWEGELFPVVKEALLNYIKNIRPNIAGCTRVFISVLPPHVPINSGTVNTMICQQFQHTEIDITGKRHGSRVFRSSIASNMINDGISTEITRRVLGHGTKYAIKHYAKIDIESMRLCALSVPKPTGRFEKILFGKEILPRV